MKYLVLALVAAVSFTAGHYLLPRKVGITHTMVEKCEELLQFRPDFEAYQKLKTADERYRKADEILGKIMTVFLADLGLRATMPVAAVPSSNSQVAASQSDHREANQPPAASPETVAETPVKKEASGREWIRYENQIKELVSENEVKDTLKKMEIKDLFSELKNAGTLSASQVQSVIGKYVGEITFFDNSHVWAVEWSLDARLRNDGRLVGKQDISLSENGKRFSHSTGDVNAFMSMPGSQGILVNVYGNDGFLQLYNNDRLDHLYANYYEKKSLDVFILKGIANLRRAP